MLLHSGCRTFLLFEAEQCKIIVKNHKSVIDMIKFLRSELCIEKVIISVQKSLRVAAGDDSGPARLSLEDGTIINIPRAQM